MRQSKIHSRDQHPLSTTASDSELRGESNVPLQIPASHQDTVELLNRYAMKLEDLVAENRRPKRPSNNRTSPLTHPVLARTVHALVGCKVQQGRDRRMWLKVHLICGVKTNIVTSVEISDGYARGQHQNKLKQCGPVDLISEWDEKVKRLLGQKTDFWGNIDF